MLTVLSLSAGAAAPLSPLADQEIRSAIKVTVGAMSLLSPDSTPVILAVRDRLDVGGVNTGANTTKVIRLKTSRNRAY